MKALHRLSGVGAPLRLTNVDTDMIIPKNYLKWLTRKGIGEGLFIEIRTLPDGRPDPAFVLNQPRYANAQFLVAGDNFGSGSSREQAPWAFDDLGIRCIISTSYGDIFYQNCFKNGILPVRLSAKQLERVFGFTETAVAPVLNLDVAGQTIGWEGGEPIGFELSTYHKELLVGGLDEIATTLSHLDRIVEFQRGHFRSSPWLGEAEPDTDIPRPEQ